MIDLAQYEQEVISNPEPELIIFPWLINRFARVKGEGQFDGKKHPIVLMNVMNEIQLYITDAELVQELMTTKNKSIDKDGMVGALLKPMLGDGIITAKNTDAYRMKRKHCALAFYKNHMFDM